MDLAIETRPAAFRPDLACVTGLFRNHAAWAGAGAAAALCAYGIVQSASCAFGMIALNTQLSVTNNYFGADAPVGAA